MLMGPYQDILAKRHFEPGLNRDTIRAAWRNLGYTVGVEVGVECGINAAAILQEWPGFLYLVDHWIDNGKPDTPMNVCIQRMAVYPGRYEIIREKSVVAAKMFAHGSLNCAYVDGTHTYEAVKEDLEAWYPVIKPGGMLSGHDFFVREPNERLGVAEAVMEFADARGLTLHVDDEPGESPNFHFFKT